VIEVHVRLAPEERVILHLPNRAGARLPALGEPVTIGWPRAAAMVFPETA